MSRPPFRTASVEAAFYYWSSKCGAEGLPGRADVRPDEMRAVLPHVFLVDVRHAPLEFRFRLVGTNICRLAGRNYTGHRLNEDEYGPHWGSVHQAYRRAVETAAPNVETRHAPWAGREFFFYERLIAPLSSDGRTVDMLFGALQQISEEGSRGPPPEVAASLDSCPKPPLRTSPTDGQAATSTPTCPETPILAPVRICADQTSVRRSEKYLKDN